MRYLTLKKAEELTKIEARIEADKIEDLLCNTDYTTSKGLFIYEQLQKDLSLLTQKLDSEI